MCRWEFCDILRSLCLMFDAISTYTLPATLAQIYPIVHCTGAISASFFNINSDINIYTLPQHKYQCQYLHPSCSQIYPIVVSCTYVQYVGWVVPVKCDLHNLSYNATFTIGKSVARMFSSGLKHRKNCECCPVTIDWQVTKIVMNPGSKRLIKANTQLHPSPRFSSSTTLWFQSIGHLPTSTLPLRSPTRCRLLADCCCWFLMWGLSSVYLILY